MRLRTNSRWFGLPGVLAALAINTANSYAAPKITSLVPNSAITGDSAFTLTVNGTGFGGLLIAATVQWNGSARQTTFVSSTRLTAEITASDIANAGTAQITVRNRGLTVDDTSASVPFAITNPVPIISSLSPASIPAGGPDFTLTVNGSNFVEGSRVRFDGSNQNTTFISKSQLTARIHDKEIRRTGAFNITVLNPSPGGGTSSAVALIVSSPVTIATASSLPAAVAGFAYSQTLTASGGTVPYSWALTGGSLPAGLSLASASGIVSGSPSTPGSFNFTVRVTDSSQPAPQTATRAFTLVVGPAAPILNSISPSSVNAGAAGFSLTVNGANFVSTSTVRWSGSNRATTFVSSSQLTAAIIAADIATPGAVSITVANPGESASNSLTLTISATPLEITTNSPLPQGTIARPYSLTLGVSGGSPPYTWSVSAGSLPGGLALNSSSGTISGTPSAAANSTFTVRVSDTTATSTTRQFQLSINSSPDFVLSGVSDSVEPAQQPTLEITLSSAHTSPTSGQLSLRFTSTADVARDDSAIQFSTGGRVVKFAVPANGTRAVFSNGATSIAFQTGTVSGTIELTVSGETGGPSGGPLPSVIRTVTVSRRAPAITRLNIASRNASGFELAITGFSTPRSLTQAVFRFTAVQGANLETSTVTLNLTTAATSWFQNQTAASLGGLFRLLVPFSVQGEVSAIQSASVTLTNGEGTSAPSSVQF